MDLPIVLNDILKKNSDIKKQKFWNILRSDPSESDGKGYVYGFTLETDNNTKTQSWIKLGRTQRDPNVRVSEWRGKMKFCVETKFNKKLERLIHLLFSFANKHRLEPDRCNEIEWFCFDEDIDVPVLVCMLKTFFEKYMDSKMSSHVTIPVLVPIAKLPQIQTTIISTSPTSSSKVNINTATVQDLLTKLAHCKTTGQRRALGPILASRVVEYRERHGKFKRIEDIKIYMIGEKRFDALKYDICV